MQTNHFRYDSTTPRERRLSHLYYFFYGFFLWMRQSVVAVVRKTAAMFSFFKNSYWLTESIVLEIITMILFERFVIYYYHISKLPRWANKEVGNASILQRSIFPILYSIRQKVAFLEKQNPKTTIPTSMWSSTTYSFVCFLFVLGLCVVVVQRTTLQFV